MPKLTIYNIQGKEAGSMDLPEVFGKDVNQAVMHQAVVMYHANQRQGNADTKIRSEVSGGNKKPFRQKGTGRARQGSSRSPLMKHGGIVFGPHPRDFGYTLPAKIRKAALRESINVRYKDNAIVCVDEVAVPSGKTKDFVKILKALKVNGKVLALFEGASKEAVLASRNVSGLEMRPVREINVFDVLKHKNILATKAAMEKLIKRVA